MMRHGRIARIRSSCLLVVAIAAAAFRCSDDEEISAADASAGAAGSDASAAGGAGGDSGTGAAGGAGAAEAGRRDVAADVDWSATCVAAAPSQPGSCLWECGCRECARVTAECLANAACKAIVDCAAEQRCDNDPSSGASSCTIKCAKVIQDNYSAGGLRASAFDQCSSTSCTIACATDSGLSEAGVKPDALPDALTDATIIDGHADAAWADTKADVGPIDAQPDISVPDAAKDAAGADSQTGADTADGPETGQSGAATG
jgi:hypothetical protein